MTKIQGLLVPEKKIFKAILVMWPGLFEQTSSIWNSTSIGPVVSSKKMFKKCRRRRTTEAYLSYKLTNEPSAQVS